MKMPRISFNKIFPKDLFFPSECILWDLWKGEEYFQHTDGSLLSNSILHDWPGWTFLLISSDWITYENMLMHSAEATVADWEQGLQLYIWGVF